MSMELQPHLSNDLVLLQPLKETDFEELFKVASDPLIWEQHPNSDRYQREVFHNYFNGAMESKGAFLILDKKDNSIMGCTRFYEYNEIDNSVAIGFTFIDRSHWGNGYNTALKKLMIDYALQSVKNIYFHVGLTNYRSQKAVEKLGAVKVAEDDKITYLIC